MCEVFMKALSVCEVVVETLIEYEFVVKVWSEC